jgi:hypothetical protein
VVIEDALRAAQRPRRLVDRAVELVVALRLVPDALRPGGPAVAVQFLLCLAVRSGLLAGARAEAGEPPAHNRAPLVRCGGSRWSLLRQNIGSQRWLEECFRVSSSARRRVCAA